MSQVVETKLGLDKWIVCCMSVGNDGEMYECNWRYYRDMDKIICERMIKGGGKGWTRRTELKVDVGISDRLVEERKRFIEGCNKLEEDYIWGDEYET